ncbi:MAG: carbohydrate binding domain-containing protein [Muribaculaceae bacterium]|nr:carbohydrate binding domain-containing protein [Muribaculaceae bacterium]
MKSKHLLLAGALAAISATSWAQTELNLMTNKVGAEVQPTMYGIFFEDINYGADGGLYAEMVKNRSFEFPQNLMGWYTFGNVEVKDDGPFDRNPHYVRLGNPGHGHKHTGLENEGFFGVSYKKGEEYRFSVWARVPDGGKARLRVQLVDPQTMGENHNMGQADITVDSKEWKKYTAVIRANETVYKGKLRIFLAKPEEAKVDLEHISLFPANTWRGHENGMRQDLAQRLYDLHPGVFRFPGGCIVEGTDLDTRYQWKNTVGPVENRPTNENRWHYTFDYRFNPDYYQSLGLGFYEYFVLSEEIGAEPLPILNVGLICQYQNDLSAQPAVSELEPYIQDALDLIEFANGDTTTTWGALRAEMGHPAPFNLKYLGIGNEQWGPEYPERLEPFLKAIRAKHPEIKLVGSSGPNSEGAEFDYLWPEMTRLKADLVDEHFYRPEDWFLAQGARYDNYDRKGPKVFAGEYACHGRGKKWNHFNAALMEAAFMTGLERNADVVHMATYAPLFAHVEGWQWRPDMIWYDNMESFPTASYYVQQLYATNPGTNVLPLLGADKKPLTGAEGQNGLFASATYDKASDEYIVKVANTSDQPQPIKLNFKGMKKNEGIKSATVTTLHSDDPNADNSLDNPNRVVPTMERMALENAQDWTTVLPAKTFHVIRFSKK